MKNKKSVKTLKNQGFLAPQTCKNERTSLRYDGNDKKDGYNGNSSFNQLKINKSILNQADAKKSRIFGNYKIKNLPKFYNFCKAIIHIGCFKK